MKSKALFLLFLLVVPATALLWASESELTRLTPQDNGVEGWKLDDVYFASDADTLMARINGAGPFYLKRGSQEVLFQEYGQGSQYVSLEVYRMADKMSAIRLYSDVKAMKPEPLNDLGDEGRFDPSLIGSYLIEFRSKSYFVRLMISQKSAASKQTILEFARAIAGKISALK